MEYLAAIYSTKAQMCRFLLPELGRLCRKPATKGQYCHKHEKKSPQPDDGRCEVCQHPECICCMAMAATTGERCRNPRTNGMKICTCHQNTIKRGTRVQMVPESANISILKPAIETSVAKSTDDEDSDDKDSGDADSDDSEEDSYDKDSGDSEEDSDDKDSTPTPLPSLQIYGFNRTARFVYNAKGSSQDKRCKNWIGLLREHHSMKSFTCQALHCEKQAAHGAHVHRKDNKDKMYLIPFCADHNVMKDGLRRLQKGIDESLKLIDGIVYIKLKMDVPLLGISY